MATTHYQHKTLTNYYKIKFVNIEGKIGGQDLKSVRRILLKEGSCQIEPSTMAVVVAVAESGR